MRCYSRHNSIRPSYQSLTQHGSRFPFPSSAPSQQSRPRSISSDIKASFHFINIPNSTAFRKPHSSSLTQRSHFRMASLEPGEIGTTTNGTAPTQSLDQLATTLQRLGLDHVPTFPTAYPELNPVDIYRAHITELLVPITGAEPQVIYQAIQWTQTLDKGDVVLPVPALRMKGKKPDEIAKLIDEKVGSRTVLPCARLTQDLPVSRISSS